MTAYALIPLLSPRLETLPGQFRRRSGNEVSHIEVLKIRLDIDHDKFHVFVKLFLPLQNYAFYRIFINSTSLLIT